ncbi:hypothetical protein AAVH_39363, partial [Aphelenchoides avenae]
EDAARVYAARRLVKDGHALDALPAELCASVEKLWNLEATCDAYERSNEFQLIDSAK